MNLSPKLATLIVLTALTALTGGVGIAKADGPSPRFSSGIVHSGTLEIELDIAGAENLTLVAISENPKMPATVTWIEAAFFDLDGNRRPSPKTIKSSATALGFQIADEQLSTLRLRVKVEAQGESSAAIQISHDAARPASAADRPQQLLASGSAGSATRGRGVYGRGTCASCHVIAGRGGRVGPDLSSIGKRASLDQIIESIAAPSAAIAPGFETNIIETQDGTPHLGFVTADSEEEIAIKDSAGQTHEIKKREIVSRKPQAYSLMPPFTEVLSDQQIIDLATFLKTLNQ